MPILPVGKLLQLGSCGWSDSSLLLSLHPDGSRLAAARGTTLCICPLIQASPPGNLPSHKASAASSADNAAALSSQEVQDRQNTHGAAGLGPCSTPTPKPQPLRFTCPSACGPPIACLDDITSLAWLAFARPPASVAADPTSHPSAHGSSGPGGKVVDAQDGSSSRSSSFRRRTNSSGSGSKVFASIQAMMEDHDLQQQHRRSTSAVPPPHPGYHLVVLLSGTRNGALQLHDADSGEVLLRQQLHPGPMVSIAVRTWRMGLKPDDAVEDVTLGWRDAVVRLAAWELRAAATSCYAAAAAVRARGGGSSSSGGVGASILGGRGFGLWGGGAAAGHDLKPLAVQKWEVPAAARGRSCVVCCGQRPRDLYSLLQGIGTSPSTLATGKTIFLAGGGRPAFLAALEVDEQGPGGGALSYITSVASSVSTGVLGLARTARSVATAPLALRDGLKAFMLNPLQLAMPPSGPTDPSGAVPAQPLASFPDPSAGQRPPSTGMWRQTRDDGRTVLALAPSPHGSLVAAVDNLGRVLLVEVGAMLVTRMWKGYRDAQVAWLEVPLATVLRRQRDLEHPSSRPQDDDHMPIGSRTDPTPAIVHGAGAASIRQYNVMPSPRLQPQHMLQPPGASTPQPQQPPSRPLATSLADSATVKVDSDGGGEYVLLLVLYAPRRQTLELWWPLHGDRLVGLAAPARARLLPRGACGELGTWRVADAASAGRPPMTPAGCMLCYPAGALGEASMVGDGSCGDGADGAMKGEMGSRNEGFELLDVADVFGLR